MVNALGAIVNRDGKVVRGNRDASGERHHLNAMIDAAYGAAGAPGNTTLTVVVTNQRLDRIILRQLGRQIHTSMARAIQPFHTTLDGDVLFAVSTQEVDNPNRTRRGRRRSRVGRGASLRAQGLGPPDPFKMRPFGPLLGMRNPNSNTPPLG